ncbi:roadblock/LC7 domain-containing protein [Deinococcus pimensis]|uniref:roadblock/LC7 domain-containing protein n=1 Tax=Deinococcus pimensis TaxID=309888 RepID=UPI00047FA267|nr:roadblock/LC7 domain-containing protein [Deinococcus pimensis]
MTSTMSKQEVLNATLSTLRANLPELKGVLVATADGLPIAQTMSAGTDANRVAAMAATALGLGKRIGDTVGSGVLTEMSVSGTDGMVFFYAAGRGVLAVVAPAGMNLGLLMMEARDAATAVSSVL